MEWNFINGEIQATTNDIKKQLEDTVNNFINVHKQIEERLKIIEEKERQWNALETLMKENSEKAKSKIKLNIGGTKFTTTKSTLLSIKDTYFYAMLSSGRWTPDEDGEYFIDRNPKCFEIILDYLRSGNLDLRGLDPDTLYRLEQDLDYYQINIPLEQYLPKNGILDQNSLIEHFNSSAILNSAPLTYQIEINSVYEPARSQNTVQSLLDDNPNTGVCCAEPGVLIVDFQKLINLENVQVIGYHGNTSKWNPSNGYGATICYSSNKLQWINTHKILTNLQEYRIIDLGRVRARYIRFEAHSYLGFGGLKFNV